MTQALSFPVPSTLGSLEAYIQGVNRFPMLTQEQEMELGRRLRRDGDVEAARALVLSHLRLVVSIARNYLGYGLPHADLIQEGNIGLMKAVKRFDPERGVRLVSFAIHWIKAEIHEYILRNWRLVKIATTKAQRKLFFNLRSLKQDLRTLGEGETAAIARQLRVGSQDVAEMEIRMSGQDVSLENGPEDAEERVAPIAYLADPADGPADALAERQIQAVQEEGLKRAIGSLDPRSRSIIERRWLSEGGGATLHELAAEYGVSAERIRQIESKAMQKIRAELAAC
ncbi:MAG: RNA polymerase sigma factor RpoH [Rhodocyclaceae bacterium]